MKKPKKKKLPFYAKVGGFNAASRPDRKAYQRGGAVSKADVDPIDPNEPHAPAGGKVTQKFKKGGIAKRAEGGDVPLPKPDPRYNIGEGKDLPEGVADKWNKHMGAVRSIVRGDKQPWESPGFPVKRKDGGKLSAAQRQSLPKSDFALPGQGTGPKGAGSGSYPIPDRSHAQNALARSSGKPVEAAVRAKVKAKYPDMGD